MHEEWDKWLSTRFKVKIYSKTKLVINTLKIESMFNKYNY